MSTTRRGFLGLFAAALAASAAAGSAVAIGSSTGEPGWLAPPKKPKKLRARHLWQHDITEQWGKSFQHRIDVMIHDERGVPMWQYGVDMVFDTATPPQEQLEPWLAMLAAHIEAEHGGEYEFEIRSFDMSTQYDAAQKWFGRVGQEPA